MSFHLDWHGAEVIAATNRARGGALRAALEFVLGESARLVPVEEGTLARSGAVSVDAGQGVGTVSYDTPYAARQHEELSWRHDPGRTAKYLERPFVGTRDEQLQIIAAHLGRTW